MIPKPLKAMIPPLKNFQTRNPHENSYEASIGLHYYPLGHGAWHNYIVITKSFSDLQNYQRPNYHLKIDLVNSNNQESVIQPFARRLNEIDGTGWNWQGAMSGGKLFEIWPKLATPTKRIEVAIREMVKNADSLDLDLGPNLLGMRF